MAWLLSAWLTSAGSVMGEVASLLRPVSQRQASSDPGEQRNPLGSRSGPLPAYRHWDSTFWLPFGQTEVCENQFREARGAPRRRNRVLHPRINALGQSSSAVGNFPITLKASASLTCKDFILVSRDAGKGTVHLVVTLSPYSKPVGRCLFPGGVCVGGGLDSLGNPTSLLQSPGGTYSEEGVGRRHPHLALASLSPRMKSVQMSLQVKPELEHRRHDSSLWWSLSFPSCKIGILMVSRIA